MPDRHFAMLIRLLRDTHASVIVEFTICLPVLFSFYVCGYLVSDQIACSRKVSVAARTLTDLLTRGLSPSAIYSNPAATDATSYMSASVITLTPYSIGHASEQVALLRVCDAQNAYVVWSQGQTQTSTGTVTAATPALVAGQMSANSVVPIPANMITAPMIPVSPDGSNVCTNYNTGTAQTTQLGTSGGFLFVSQLTYSYQPAFNYGFPTIIPMSEAIYMSPRLN